MHKVFNEMKLKEKKTRGGKEDNQMNMREREKKNLYIYSKTFRVADLNAIV